MFKILCVAASLALVTFGTSQAAFASGCPGCPECPECPQQSGDCC